MKNRKPKILKQGFTVVELLVAMGLFTTLMAITSGVFIKVMRTQRQITALIAANNNASLTMEQMAREVRTGKTFCSAENSPCQNFGAAYKELIFTNVRNEKVKYYSNASQIVKTINDGASIPLTAANVSVQDLSFYLQGNGASDGKQPRITMTLKIGAAGLPSVEGFIVNLATTISPRTLQD